MDKEEIKNFRSKHNLNQAELAEIAKVKVGTVQSWEQGKRNISAAAMELLHNYNNVLYKKEKPPIGEVGAEDLIARRVYEELEPLISKMTEEVIKNIGSLDMKMKLLSEYTEELHRLQEKTQQSIEVLEKKQ